MRERKSAKLNSQQQPQQQQQQQQQQHQNGHLSPFKLAKLLDPDASWDKDQLGDVLHWIRQALGLVCGLLWGAIPLVGGIWFLLFVALSTGIIYAYYALVLKIDEEEFGGHGALLQEGLFASICVFLLAWILVYSLAHFDHHGLLALCSLTKMMNGPFSSDVTKWKLCAFNSSWRVEDWGVFVAFLFSVHY